MEKNRARTNSLTEEASSNKRMLYLIAIMVIGFNLRPAITSVGPLLGTIRDQLDWKTGVRGRLPVYRLSHLP